jgi:hypothetical protein
LLGDFDCVITPNIEDFDIRQERKTTLITQLR